MSVFTPFKPEICKVCENRGYYQVGIPEPTRSLDIAPPPPGQIAMMAFCACSAGKQLRQIVKDFRLSDIKSFGEPILNQLRVMENKWKNREEPRKMLRKLVLETEKVIQQTKEMEHES